MGERTKISWCDSTLNFWSGCSKVSPGCAHCYAETLSDRYPTLGAWGPAAKRKIHESAFKLATRLNRRPWVCDYCGQPGLVNKHGTLTTGMCVCRGVTTFHRRTIFSLSLGDWLDYDANPDFRVRMLQTVRQCDNVIWLLLSKRVNNFKMLLYEAKSKLELAGDKQTAKWIGDWIQGNPPPRVWLGTSVEDQDHDDRILDLLKLPAAGRFLSMEPLLEDVDIQSGLGHNLGCGDALAQPGCKVCGWLARKVDWVIVGGESGPKARPCNIEWIRNIRDQCREASVPVFVKQLGENLRSSTGMKIELRYSKGGDPSEWPEDLRVQEVPDAPAP